MTTTPHRPMPDPELRPFTTEPGRWRHELQQAQARIKASALDGGPGYRQEGHRGEELARIDERTDWGWLRWPAPYPNTRRWHRCRSPCCRRRRPVPRDW